MYRSKHIILLAIPTILALFMTGCGGEANYSLDDARPTFQGKFIDDAVEGLEYSRSNGDTGITQKGGYYNYKQGDLITFHIGALELGTSSSGSLLTPRELANGAIVIEDQKVSNRVRLLLALDKDPKIGIQISDTMRQQASRWDSTMNFDQNETAFSDTVQQVTKGDILGTSLPSKVVADEHFRKTLTCAYSGAYEGAWDVPDSNEDSGYVGVMLQANSSVVVMGDGQTVNNQDNSVIYVVGNHDINTKSYVFNPGVYYYYNRVSKVLEEVRDGDSISGTGIAKAYDHIVGSFAKGTQSGSYEVKRADASSNAAYRFTGFGWNTSGGLPIGMIIMDVDPDRKVSGLIHYIADVTIQPQLHGTVDFDSGEVNITVEAPDQNSFPIVSNIKGNINFNDTSITSKLTWETIEGAALGSVDLDGCQLQSMD